MRVLSNDLKSCHMCFAPAALYIKLTKKGGFYFRCRACFSRGFIDTELAWRGFALIETLSKVMTEAELARAVDAGPEPVLKLVPRHLMPAAKRESEEAGHG